MIAGRQRREPYQVAGRTVLITGAARGIGAALARRLHAAGANVSLVGLEPDRLTALAAGLGPRAAWFEADVTDNDAVVTAVEGTASRFGGIDVAVANAGLSFIGTLATQPMEQWLRTIDVNLNGVYRTNRAVVPHIVASGGYLLNIASLAAVAHAPLMSAYTASKAGVEALTDALRAELLPTSAHAGCAYFGFIETDLVRGAYETGAASALNATQPGFLKTPIPPDQAVDAIERGISRRAKRIWAPRFVGPVLALRSTVTPILERTFGAKRDQLARALLVAKQDADQPVDLSLGVAVTDGQAAGERGPARDLV